MPDPIEIDKDLDTSIRKGTWDTTNYIQKGEVLPFVKCNVFTDDALKKHWGINIPRLFDVSGEYTKKAYPGAKESPIRASTFMAYALNRKKFQRSGVYEVSIEMAQKLANRGDPVIANSWAHISLMASGEKWPVLYRSNLEGRDHKTERTKVGFRPDHQFKFFWIDKEEYEDFEKDMKDSEFTHYDIWLMQPIEDYEKAGYNYSDIYNKKVEAKNLLKMKRLKDPFKRPEVLR